MVTLPVSEEEVRDGYTVEFIKNKLQEKLSAEHVEVVDQSEFGQGASGPV